LAFDDYLLFLPFFPSPCVKKEPRSFAMRLFFALVEEKTD
jgi:hypothetical protein